MAIVSVDLHAIVIGSLFQIAGTATEKARLPLFIVVLRTKRCLKTNDLRVIKRSEKWISAYEIM